MEGATLAIYVYGTMVLRIAEGGRNQVPHWGCLFLSPISQLSASGQLTRITRLLLKPSWY